MECSQEGQGLRACSACTGIRFDTELVVYGLDNPLPESEVPFCCFTLGVGRGLSWLLDFSMMTSQLCCRIEMRPGAFTRNAGIVAP